MMEALFWKVLGHLQSLDPSFVTGGRYKGLPKRFKRAVHAVDSSTIQLVANCMDWAKHRRRKAAAKLHLRLNLQNFLPTFAIVDVASHHDDSRASELCAGLQSGEIVVFDKAYVNFSHLWDLAQRGVFWVTRAKDNMSYHVCHKLLTKPQGRILRDDLITLKTKKSRDQHPGQLRRIQMLVLIDGKEVEMTFITNNMEWAARSIGDLYKSRWGIEVFFKQIKQTLQICDFLGHSKEAIRWQLWSALLLYIFAAISELEKSMASRIHASIHGDARSAMGSLRSSRCIAILWDSRREHSNVRKTRTSLSPGNKVRSMGQQVAALTQTEPQNRSRKATNSEKEFRIDKLGL